MQFNSKFDKLEILQTIIDSIPLGIHVWSNEYKLISFNESIIKILGIERCEGFDYESAFLKASMVVQSCGTAANVKIRSLLKTLEQEGTVTTDWLHHRADGVVIPTEVTMTCAHMGEHSIRIAYIRVKDEKKLKKVQELSSYLQALYNSSFIGIGIWDNKLNFVDCNPKLLQMFETESRKDVSEIFNSFAPEYQVCGKKSADLAKKYANRVYQKGVAIFEWHCITKSGKNIFLQVHSERIYYDGNIVALCVFRDFTKEKTLEYNAKLAIERTNFMFSNAPMGIAMFDKATGIMDANEALWRGLGFNSKENFLQNFYNASPLVQPCKTPSAAKWQAFNNIAMKHGFVNSEWMFKTISGEDFPVYLTLRNMKYEGEDVTLAFVRDLREEKALLSSLSATQEQLQEALLNAEKAK